MLQYPARTHPRAAPECRDPGLALELSWVSARAWAAQAMWMESPPCMKYTRLVHGTWIIMSQAYPSFLMRRWTTFGSNFFYSTTVE